MGNDSLIKLVALDLDGTLLDNDGRLPARNVQRIAEAQAQGVGIMLATGKTRQSAVSLIAEMGLNMPSVFSQGLLVCAADGSIMREVTLDWRLAEEIVNYLDEQALPYVAYNRDGILVRCDHPYFADLYAKYGEPYPQVLDSLAGRTRELRIHKFLIGDPLNLAARRVDLEQRFGRTGKIYQAVPEYVEIMPQGLSKGGGVRWLLQQLGISPERLLAVGDGENDIEMLQLAGIGVAMGNANATVKAAADAIVGSNDDGGVAEALERFVLK